MDNPIQSSQEAAILAAQSIPYAAPSKDTAKYISYLTLKDIAGPQDVIKDALDLVCGGLLRKKAEDRRKIRNAARTILANLVHCIYSRSWLAVPTKPVMFNKGGYLHDQLFLTHRPTMAVLDKLVQLGWLLPPIPGNNLAHVATMYCPTLEAEKHIFDWLYLVEKPFDGQYVWASQPSETNSKKKWKRYLGSEASLSDLTNMQAINDHLRQQSYALHGPQSLIYMEGPDMPISGGRVYMDLQRLPDKKAKVRLNTLINDQPVVEIDLKANHLRMAAALFKEELPVDPYEPISRHLGMPRDIVKLAINRSLGSDHAGRVQYGAAHDKETPIAPEIFKSIMNEVSKLYPYIKFNQGLGAMLQSLEGQIMISAQLKLIQLGITALPIHDALMVNQNLMTEAGAEHILKECWSNQLGVSFAPHTSKDQV